VLRVSETIYYEGMYGVTEARFEFMLGFVTQKKTASKFVLCNTKHIPIFIQFCVCIDAGTLTFVVAGNYILAKIKLIYLHISSYY